MNRARIHQFSAWACSVFMLGLLPLLFRDAFFDINRVKVQAVCFVCPVLFAFTISCTCKRKNCSGIAHCEGVSAFMLLWLVSALISYIASGFDPAVLSGSEGRYCGLFFLFSCGAAFYTISSMRYGDFAVWLAVCTAAFVAALGLLHTYGVDPLGFYARIQKGQTQYFLSTIGNIDFFGAYLAMVLPFAMGLAIFSEALSLRLLGFAASLIQMAGVACARTDVAFAAMQVSCLLLFTLSSETWGSIRRALFLWSVSWLMLPAIQAYMHHGYLAIDYSGVLLALCESRAAHVIGIILLFSAILTYFAENLHIALPERRSALRILFALSFLFIAVLIASMVFFTYFQLGDDDISSLLRFSDTWGSRRGFVYRCSLNALQEYTPLQWLFGKGLDKTRAILTPYFDNPQMLASGIFNDVHCQPLQMLLTCGIAGMLAFVGFYLSMLKHTITQARRDPILCGAVAFLAGYAVIMFLSVTQPIIIAVYISLCALTLSKIIHSDSKEACHEP